jgi:hypothetical protein
MVWLTDEQWMKIARICRPTSVARSGSMTAGDQRHSACVEKRLPLVRLPAGIRTVHHGL